MVSSTDGTTALTTTTTIPNHHPLDGLLTLQPLVHARLLWEKDATTTTDTSVVSSSIRVWNKHPHTTSLLDTVLVPWIQQALRAYGTLVLVFLVTAVAAVAVVWNQVPAMAAHENPILYAHVQSHLQPGETWQDRPDLQWELFLNLWRIDPEEEEDRETDDELDDDDDDLF